MSVLTVDAGTSVVKAVLFDGDGREVAVERAEVTVQRPHQGWAEQDMDSVWQSVCGVARKLVARHGEDIELITTTGQGDGCWLVDRHGRPTGPAILWQDARAAGIVESWRAEGVLDRAARVNGSVAFAGLPHAILRWLKEHDPSRLDAAAAALTCNGWLHLKLTGQLTAEASDASVPFLDIRSGRYSETLLDLYGVAWAEPLLPPPTPCTATLAALTEAAAVDLGLRPGVPVVMAPYDVAASAVGLGAVAPGSAFSILGTTLCTGTMADTDQLDSDVTKLELSLGVDQPVLRVFPTLTGTGALDWAAGLLGLGSAESLIREAISSPPGAAGVRFLPYVSPAGERTPFLDTQVRGSWLNLSQEHGRSVLARSVLEGLSLSVRDCLTAAAASERVVRLHVCGGGSRDDVWMQLLADITQTEVVRSPDSETGAKGAFICGMAALEGIPDLAGVVRSSSEPVPTARPTPRLACVYDELYDEFVASRELLRSATSGRPETRTGEAPQRKAGSD